MRNRHETLSAALCVLGALAWALPVLAQGQTQAQAQEQPAAEISRDAFSTTEEYLDAVDRRAKAELAEHAFLALLAGPVVRPGRAG